MKAGKKRNEKLLPLLVLPQDGSVAFGLGQNIKLALSLISILVGFWRLPG